MLASLSTWNQGENHLIFTLTPGISRADAGQPKYLEPRRESSRFSPAVRFGTPPLPYTQASVYPPPPPPPVVPGGGGGTLAWKSQFGRGDRHFGTLGINILCA
jgi:hypothetical protein